MKAHRGIRRQQQTKRSFILVASETTRQCARLSHAIFHKFRVFATSQLFFRNVHNSHINRPHQCETIESSKRTVEADKERQSLITCILSHSFVTRYNVVRSLLLSHALRMLYCASTGCGNVFVVAPISLLLAEQR